LLGTRLREVGFESPEQVGATFVGDAPWLAGRSAGAPILTDDYPQRLWLSRRAMAPSEARALFDRGGPDYERVWIDPLEARDRFEKSDFIRRLWPEGLRDETLPFFTYQRSINRVLADGANPLRQIEEIHQLLTQTTLRTLPAWLLGLGNLTLQNPSVNLSDVGGGRTEYFKGLAALVDRDYSAAVANLLEAERRGLAGVRTLLAYALCLAGRAEEASYVIAMSPSEDSEVRRFWSWLDTTFHLRAAPTAHNR
jgi:hypothetical protein